MTINDTVMFMANNFTSNPTLSLFNKHGNLQVTGNIITKWVWSYDFYLLLILIFILIGWNIWLTSKLKTKNGEGK